MRAGSSTRRFRRANRERPTDGGTLPRASRWSTGRISTTLASVHAVLSATLTGEDRYLNVVLDFGVWGKDERSALRALVASVGATCELVYLHVDEEEQWRRVQARSLSDAGLTFAMTNADLERWRQIFQPPDASELETADIDPPPAGFDSWEGWVAQWWPTSLAGNVDGP